MNLKISVIIPFYSNFYWLEDAVTSVINQTHRNTEIIIINDGSREDDNPFLTKFKGEIKYIKTINRGPAAARNLGIENARGDYIAFLDSDDLWHPKKLEIQLKYMVEKNMIWSHTSYELFRDSNKKLIKTINVSHFKGDVFIKCLVSSPIATPCVMIQRAFLELHKDIRFSEKMHYGEDGFMWIKSAQYLQLGVVPLPLTKVRMRGTNAALKAKVQMQAKFQLWNFFKKQIKSDSKFKSIPEMVRIAYELNGFNFRILCAIGKLRLNSSLIEIIAKILYLPTYIILKSCKYKLKYHV